MPDKTGHFHTPNIIIHVGATHPEHTGDLDKPGATKPRVPRAEVRKLTPVKIAQISQLSRMLQNPEAMARMLTMGGAYYAVSGVRNS